MAKAPTQAEQIVNYIRKYGSITRLDAARDLFIFELSARIIDLQKRGFVFSKKWENHKNRLGQTKTFVRYFIEEEGAL